MRAILFALLCLSGQALADIPFFWLDRPQGRSNPFDPARPGGPAPTPAPAASPTITSSPTPCPPPTILAYYGDFGSGYGQLSRTTGTGWGLSNTVYVLDKGNTKVAHFSASGSILGEADLLPRMPLGKGTDVMVVDAAHDRIYASAGHQVIALRLDLSYVGTCGSYGSGPGQFISVTAMDVDAAGNLYVGDAAAYQIQRFSPALAYTGAVGTYGIGCCSTFNFLGQIAISGDKLLATDRSGYPEIFNLTTPYFGFACEIHGSGVLGAGGVLVDPSGEFWVNYAGSITQVSASCGVGAYRYCGTGVYGTPSKPDALGQGWGATYTYRYYKYTW